MMIIVSGQKRVFARKCCWAKVYFVHPLEAEHRSHFSWPCAKHMPGKLSLSRQWHSWTWNVMFLLYSYQTMYMKPQRSEYNNQRGSSQRSDLITKEVVAKGVYHVGEESPLTAPMRSNTQRNHSASPVAFPSRIIGPVLSVPCLFHIFCQTEECYL